MAKEKSTDINIFRHAAVLVAFGATANTEALCAACGHATNEEFTFVSGQFAQTISGDMTECQLGHFTPESLGGKLIDGCFPLHKICNQTNTVWNLDIFCNQWQTVLTADEIRTRFAESQCRAEQMINGTAWYSDIAIVANKLLDRLANYRTKVPQKAQDRIRQAA